MRKTPEQIERVIKLWLEKLSVEEMAEELGVGDLEARRLLARHFPPYRKLASDWRDFQRHMAGDKVRHELGEHKDDAKKLFKERKLE